MMSLDVILWTRLQLVHNDTESFRGLFEACLEKLRKHMLTQSDSVFKIVVQFCRSVHDTKTSVFI